MPSQWWIFVGPCTLSVRSRMMNQSEICEVEKLTEKKPGTWWKAINKRWDGGIGNKMEKYLLLDSGTQQIWIQTGTSEQVK